MSGNYIKLYRSFLEWDWWHDAHIADGKLDRQEVERDDHKAWIIRVLVLQNRPCNIPNSRPSAYRSEALARYQSDYHGIDTEKHSIYGGLLR